MRTLRNLLMGNGLVAGRMETKQSRTSAQSLVTCSFCQHEASLALRGDILQSLGIIGYHFTATNTSDVPEHISTRTSPSLVSSSVHL